MTKKLIDFLVKIQSSIMFHALQYNDMAAYINNKKQYVEGMTMGKMGNQNEDKRTPKKAKKITKVNTNRPSKLSKQSDKLLKLIKSYKA